MLKMYIRKFIILSFLMLFFLFSMHSVYAYGQDPLYPSIAMDSDGWTYYIDDSDNGAVYKKSYDNHTILKIADANACKLIVHDQWIYYLMNENPYENSGALYRMKTDGSENQLLKDRTQFRDVESLILTNSQLYFNFDWNLYSMNLDGSLEKELIKNSKAVKVYGRHIYYVENYKTLTRVDLFTQEKTSHTFDIGLDDFFIKDNWIYCVTQYDVPAKFFKIKTDFTGMQELNKDYEMFENIVLNNSVIYASAEKRIDGSPVTIAMTLEGKLIDEILPYKIQDFSVTNKELFYNERSHFLAYTLSTNSSKLFENPMSAHSIFQLENKRILYVSSDGLYIDHGNDTVEQISKLKARNLKFDGNTIVYNAGKDPENFYVYNIETKKETIIANPDRYNLVGVDQGRIYLMNQLYYNQDDIGYLYALDFSAKDTTNMTPIIEFTGHGTIKDGYLYKKTFKPSDGYDGLLRINLETLKSIVIVKRSIYDIVIDSDNKKLYYNDAAAGKRSIYSNNINGGNEIRLYTSADRENPINLFQFDSHLIFTVHNMDAKTNDIYQMNVDGSHLKHLINDGANFMVKRNDMLLHDSYNRTFFLAIDEATHSPQLVESIKD